MEKVQFQVELLLVLTATGADQITFLAPNPGRYNLNSNCLWGEMSRFFVALKACFLKVDPAGTLVIDEIDVELGE